MDKGANTSTIADAAVGTVNANQWYELTAKVAGTAIAVYLNGTLEAQGTDSTLRPGSVALYGEAGTAGVLRRVRAPVRR